jgi:uncharacterized membrane protein YbaN (DUF454 family)
MKRHYNLAIAVAPLSTSTKVLYGLLAVACVVIGLVGLLIPIIPGLLFLLGALYLVGRISTRVQRWSDRQPRLQRMHARLEGMRHVSIMDRMKVVGLSCLEVVTRGLERGVLLLRGILRRKI